MTDSQSALSEVPALLDERRRYESWLAALEARRESTPQHVFQRVQADYRARLQRVAEQLASHRQAIEEERGHLQARVAVIEAEEGLRRDERAELELRAHVGELEGDDATSAFGAVDQTIGTLVDERQALEVRIAELTSLLVDEVKTLEPESSDPSPAEAQVAGGSPNEPPAGAEAVATDQLPAEHHAASAQTADAPVAVEQPVKPSRPAPPAGPAVAPKSAPPPAAGAPADPARARGARGSFDELAFLSSVVGKNDGGSHTAKKEGATAGAKHDGPLVERRSSEPLLKAPSGITQDENAADSLLAGVENARLATGEHPLAANVTANTPIVLRPATTLEQSKTLKCNECGGLNYPTEWYCERCGAELAAL